MIILAKKKEQISLIYKNRPLVKRGNTVIYGDIDDDYYICITILESEPYKDLELATDVEVALMSGARIIRKAEREGIYRALDIGAYWLEEALAEEN